MKNQKLKDLIQRVESASDTEKSEFISLTDELAVQVYGGVLPTNTGCTNNSCTGGSNGTCVNNGCTDGTSNNGCTNNP